MSEYQKQTAFFKAVVLTDGEVEHRRLRERILRAEYDERCVRSAFLKSFLLAFLSVVGFAYSAVITPAVIIEHEHYLRKFFEVMALGSVLAMMIYMACWFYYRAVMYQVHSDCRKYVMSLVSRQTDVYVRPRVERERVRPAFQPEALSPAAA